MNTENHGFDLLYERSIDEIGTLAKLYRHHKSGAELLSLINDDDNKVFGIAFATPSNDSTGIAHVMEHSVLCGSRKYQTKEPFVELIKGSLNTFVNAMTWPDHTVYPVASQHPKDFYNLIDVYLDAVFYPTLSRWTLMQEGWHYELGDPSEPLRYKGVVFNEMKGNYSSPDSMLSEYIRQSLLPDTIYGHDSGGDPAHIPDLSFSRFKQFHADYYHPSNARIVFSGNDDPLERLRYLDGWLNNFEKKAIRIDLPLVQQRWQQPRRFECSYDPGAETEEVLCFVSVNWLLGDCFEPDRALALEILAHILAGTPASPLRKRLIDSGMGEDVTGGYVDNDCREWYFTIGLRGVLERDVDRVETLILDTVRELAEQGVDPCQVDASLNTVEFNLREANFGGFPRGIVHMIQALQTWIYGHDPLAHLAFERPLASLKSEIAQGKNPFREILKDALLGNMHRSTVIMRPDSNWLARRESEEEARLAAVRASLSNEQVRAIIEETQSLHRLQVAPDTPEALASIPSLRREDLDTSIRTIPTELDLCSGVRTLWHEMPTHGLVYLDLAFDMHSLAGDDVPLLGLFGNVLLEMGTESQDYVALTQRIGRDTGGIVAGALHSVHRPTRSGVSQFTLRGKSTFGNADELAGVLSDVLTRADLNQPERFRQIVLEEKASLESDLVPSGSAFAEQRLRSRFSGADWAAEQSGGVSYLLFLRQLADRVEREWPHVLIQLERIRSRLLTRNALTLNVTADGMNRRALGRIVSGLIDRLPEGEPPTSPDWYPVMAPSNEGFAVTSQVNFVAKGADLHALGHRVSGAWLVVQNWLSTTYLWERVRVRGGAYGGACRLDPLTGALVFSSYRDPNVAETLQVYDNAGGYLRAHQPSREEIERAIIGVIGGQDRYLLPDAKGYAALFHELTGMSDPARQQLRDEILGARVQDFLEFANALDDVAQHGSVVVLGSSAAIEEAQGRTGFPTMDVLRLI